MSNKLSHSAASRYMDCPTSYKICFIYGLINLKTNKIFYIGKSINPKKRLSNHFSKSNLAKKSLLVKELKNLSREQVRYKILAKCKINNENKLEKSYITKYKNLGYNLVNQRIGGDGWQNISKKKFNFNTKPAILSNQRKVTLRNVKTSKEYFFDSVKESANFLKTESSTVHRILSKKGYIVKGFFARYSNEQFIKPKDRFKKVKGICITNGKILCYEYANLARKDGFDPSVILKVCKNLKHRLQHKGYIWEFINE